MADFYTFDFNNSKIIFKNFSGEEHVDRHSGKVLNAKGTRTFCLIIEDPDMVTEMVDTGWNIKILTPSEDHPEPAHFLPVEARYRNKNGELKPGRFQPHITRYCGRVADEITEDNVHELDEQNFLDYELTINGNEYEPGHIKAYLNDMCVLAEPKSVLKSKWDAKYGDPNGFADDSDPLPFD